jgi:hypothetical protein
MSRAVTSLVNGRTVIIVHDIALLIKKYHNKRR